MDDEQMIDEFPFEYKGGGYWRHKGVPKGDKAEILHGEQVLEEFLDHVNLTGIKVEFLAELLRLFNDEPIQFLLLILSMPDGDRCRTNASKLDALKDMASQIDSMNTTQAVTDRCGALAVEFQDLAMYLTPGRGRKSSNSVMVEGVS